MEPPTSPPGGGLGNLTQKHITRLRSTAGSLPPTTRNLRHLHKSLALKDTVTGLERERDFYFSKLRDIELLLQQACEADSELEKDEDGLIEQVLAILYSTEVVWEVGWQAPIRPRLALTVHRKGLRYQLKMALSMIRRLSEERGAYTCFVLVLRLIAERYYNVAMSFSSRRRR